MRLFPRCALVLAFSLATGAVAAADGPLYLDSKLPVADDAGFSKELLADCPLQEEFSLTLQRNLRREGARFADGAVPTAKGRSLKVELVDASISGNGFIGHQQYMRLRGTLFQDGKKVAAFSDRAQFQDSGLTTACFEIRAALKAEAYYIGRWVRSPVDGQELKHFGE